MEKKENIKEKADCYLLSGRLNAVESENCWIKGYNEFLCDRNYILEAENEKLYAIMHELGCTIADISGDCVDYNTHVEILKNDIEELQKELEKEKKRNERLEDDLYSTCEEYGRLVKENNRQIEINQKYEKEVSELNSHCETLLSANHELSEQLDDMKKANRGLAMGNDLQQKSLDECEKKLRRKGLISRLFQGEAHWG